jgi:hypothetical protein
VSYTTESGRRQILDDASAAAVPLAAALAVLGDIYDLLDEQTADRMEARLFKPLQGAYGQLRRTLTEFAARTSLPAPSFAAGPAQLPSDPHSAIEHVADWTVEADEILAELQDTLLPVEVGDAELRAGLSGTRTAITPLPSACVELLRTLGR